ncbi:MAG: sodium-translocating pyrophosphatase [Dehalococcoidia bacterium]|nr:MAG: sodium-translocating pyrophosphatase [Dehalococcoidia bacterium]
MNIEMIPVLLAGLLSLAFAGYLVRYILRQDQGSDKVREIASAIQEGARAFLQDEFRALVIVTVIMVAIFAAALEPRPWVGLSYLVGTLTSALAGYLGMSIAVRANGRTATAATSSWAQALRIAFSGGAVMGFCVVGLGLLGLSIIVMIFDDPDVYSHVWLGYAVGASIVALFLRVGGGIFTKSADVGADLVGKVEAGIPEDDPRNPAVIADNVGDNVGDIAGMGSDLFESYVSAIVAAMVLGAAVGVLGPDKGISFPLLLGAVGVVAAIIGTFFVRAPEAGGSFEEQTAKARSTMNRGVYASNILMIVGGFLLVWFYLSSDEIGVFYAMLAGLACGFLIGLSTEYFTSERGPVKGIVEASQTGAGTNVIEGLSVGMFSTVVPIVLVAAATLIAYETAGLFGIAIAAEGMLITLGMLLAIDCYGPIADNAAGIAEMGGLGKEVRARTEALDSVGNTTAAIGKGFAISSAALAALAWLATFFAVVEEETGKAIVVSLTEPKVIVGLLIGAMLSFLFSALAMRAVSSGAVAVVSEVRRQFKEIPGLMDGTGRADYATCVDITTRRALKGMIVPGLLVIIVPLIIGFSLGLEALAGFLVGSLATGFLLAILMANSGGAWDNAKKYIEAGHLGGKGSDAHKAAVIGDTVGDPFKDTAGPSLNILIKLVGKVAVIFVPIFVLVV